MKTKHAVSFFFALILLFSGCQTQRDLSAPIEIDSMKEGTELEVKDWSIEYIGNSLDLFFENEESPVIGSMKQEDETLSFIVELQCVGKDNISIKTVSKENISLFVTISEAGQAAECGSDYYRFSLTLDEAVNFETYKIFAFDEFTQEQRLLYSNE